MMMLRPPFEGTNPLAVASRIVEGAFEPARDPPGGPPFSAELKRLVAAMMTPDPNRYDGLLCMCVWMWVIAVGVA